MKKKVMALALCLSITLGITACSNDDDSKSTGLEQVSLNQLPENTQQFIQGTFPNTTLLQANKLTKSNYYGSIYKIKLNNNVAIDFDREGNWTEIETSDYTELPANFLAQEVPVIQAYVLENFKGKYIIEIDKDRKGYEVKLNNQQELIFNARQEFVGIDIDVDQEEQLIGYDQLPTAVQSFLTSYFATSEIVFIKQEEDKGGTTYKVYVANGFKIEFNHLGEWEEIETKQNQIIPPVLLPTPLIVYIETNYKGYQLVSIEKKSSVFEVELKRGQQEVALIFDREGNFLQFDN